MWRRAAAAAAETAAAAHEEDDNTTSAPIQRPRGKNPLVSMVYTKIFQRFNN